MRKESDPHAPTANLSPAASALPREEPEVAEGDRVGRYVVRRRLGQGGMGIVFEAEDLSLQRRVALKVLLRCHEPEQAVRLVREARAAAGLSHPNVVAVHEVGIHEGGGPFIAMELVPGQTARHWLAAAPRSWRQVVEVFRQAGLGLAAAHAAGIVHRDVKPDNILVGDDGRVRVADFGLAFPAEQREQASGGGRGSAPGPDRLTDDGAVVGTPHYMAPEQRRGDPVDARADQYGFCVALRDSLAQPPSWIEAIVRRGLAEDPAARWPSMAALVAELDRDPARRRRRILVAAGGLALVLAATGIAYRAGVAPDPCAGSARPLAGVWDAPRRDALARAFASSGKAQATPTFARVAARLDGYAADWARAREQSCRATRERGERSERLFDLRAQCLERQLGRVRAVVELMEQRAGESMDKAVDVVRDSTASLCQDDDALLAAYPPPADPALRARVQAVDRETGRLYTMSRLGRMKDAVAGLRELLPKARELDHPPLLTTAVYALAWAEYSLGNFDAAIPLLNETVRVAGRARADDLSASAWIDLLAIHGNLKEDEATTTAILPAVEAAVARHDSPATRSSLAGTLGRIYQKRGKIPEARAQYEASLREEERRPRNRNLITALINMSWIERQVGRAAIAEMYLRRALEAGIVLYGEQNVLVGDVWQNLALLFIDQSRLDEGRAAHETTLAIYRATLPPDNRRILIQLENLSALALQANQFEDAERRYEEVAAMAERTLKPEDPIRGHILNLGGVIALDTGRPAPGRARCQEAVKVLESVGRRDWHLADARACLGRALLGVGEVAPAVAMLESAVALAESIELAPTTVAPYRWALARATWQAGRRADAEALVARALGDTPAPKLAALEAEVGEWRRTRGR